MRERVLVGMSGGVDSSVAAYLLCKEYEVVGATMKLLSSRESSQKGCCSLADVEDARAVARALGIRYYLLNYEDIFQREVMQNFLESYERGVTPLPCARCNQSLKFEVFLKEALQLGFSFIATGHYAKKKYSSARGRYELFRARDREKDQTYFLYGLTQAQLGKALFPLGDFTKSEVRSIADQQLPVVSQKQESQDLCFVEAGTLKQFLSNRVKTEKGDIVTEEGEVVGNHEGIAFYTVGQRRGLRVARGERVYVTKILPKSNQLVIGSEDDLCRDSFEVEQLNWIAFQELEEAIDCEVQVRYRQSPVEAVIYPLSENRLRCETKHSLRAVTPGQAAVFYQGEKLLGGGTIGT